jgi:hypothetical protein
MDFFTVCVVATAADVERARPLCLEWTKTQHEQNKTAAEMLPTELSPTGSAPATHHLCTLQLTQAQHDHMLAFITAHNVPVKAELIGPQADGCKHTIPNRDQWLTSNQLKVVS